MMLLAATTFLAVVSSELGAALEHESRGYDSTLSSRYAEGSEKFGEESLRGQDVKNDRGNRSENKRNRSQNLNKKESDDYDQSGESNWLSAVPGVPGKDYPNLETIPQTSFTCADKKPGGYYADVETRCQVFHVCNVGGVKSSFLCPPGSIFNQKYLVCDWWYDFECENASDLYSLNESINRGGVGSGPSGPGEYYTADKNSKLNSEKEYSFAYPESNWVNDGVDLSLAGTGEGGLGYSRNKSNRPFGEYQTNITQGRQFPGMNGNTDLAKQFDRQTTLGNDRRNEISQRGSSHADQSIYLAQTNNDRTQSFNGKDQYLSFRNENSNNNNIPVKYEDYSQPESRRQFSDYTPRGFSVNYGKSEKGFTNFNQEIQKQETNQQIGPCESRLPVANDAGRESSSGEENYYKKFQKGDKNKNANTRGNYREEGTEEAVLNSNSDEDEFDRERQREVDNTILNKKTLNDENRGFIYEFDAETEKLTSENPPSIESGSYYDSENYFADESNVPFPQNMKLKSRIEENTDKSNGNLNENKEQTRLRQNNGDRRPSGGFRNGPGNGFPSPNKELVGSNVIAGITTSNSRFQKSEGYSNSRDIPNFNYQSSVNKETGYTDERPNAENNGSFSDEISTPSSVKTPSGSRSPGKITEITGRDNSRTINDEFTLLRENNLAKESFEIGFNGNENRRTENTGRYPSSDQFRSENKNGDNLNHANERNNYVPPFNF